MSNPEWQRDSKHPRGPAKDTEYAKVNGGKVIGETKILWLEYTKLSRSPGKRKQIQQNRENPERQTDSGSAAPQFMDETLSNLGVQVWPPPPLSDDSTGLIIQPLTSIAPPPLPPSIHFSQSRIHKWGSRGGQSCYIRSSEVFCADVVFPTGSNWEAL